MPRSARLLKMYISLDILMTQNMNYEREHKMTMRNRALAFLLFTLSVIFLTGCSTFRYTYPPRTATEQYLLSYAGIQSINKLEMPDTSGKKIFIEDAYFESVDQKFMIGQIREHLLTDGALLVSDKEQSELLVEIRSAGVGINTRELLLGIPSIPIPFPFYESGVMALPEVVIFKRTKNEAFASLAATAYERGNGNIVCCSGPEVGNTLKIDYNIVGIVFTKTRNLPK